MVHGRGVVRSAAARLGWLAAVTALFVVGSMMVALPAAVAAIRRCRRVRRGPRRCRGRFRGAKPRCRRSRRRGVVVRVSAEGCDAEASGAACM